MFLDTLEWAHDAGQRALPFVLAAGLVLGTYFAWARLFARAPNEPRKGKQFSLAFPEQSLPHWKGKRVSKMDIRDENDPDLIWCLCPATGQLMGSVRAANTEDIDRAVAAAGAAQKQWASKTSFADRRRVLRTILRFISEHQSEIARVACRDTGKTMLDASLGEIMVTLEKIQWILQHGEDSLAVSKRPGSTNMLLFYKGAEVRYQPLGTVCAMVSWNYPLHNMMGPIVAALFAGNSIVVKCSEQVVWSSQFFLQIARRALEIEGFDPDVVQLISCWPETADHLTTHPDIAHITFIGSRPVAHAVAAAAAMPLTPVVVELGGKDPLIVLDDVGNQRLHEISSIIMRGTFQSAGQNCIGVERVLALPKSFESLETILAKRVKDLRIGSSIDEPTDIDMGALINSAHIDRLEGLIRDAVAQGAKLVTGGHRFSHPKYPLGIYFEPTLLTQVTRSMKIAQEEVFGPVLLLMRTDDVDDAIDVANSTVFGLGASVFGSNKPVINRIVDELRCGNVAINDFATYHMCQLPFGGVGGSGYGKFGGAEGLRGLCIEKSVCYDRFPFISTFIPEALDYPIPSVTKAWAMVEGLQNVGYGQGLWTKVKGLRRMTGL